LTKTRNHEKKIQYDRAFLTKHIELRAENDAWVLLETTLSHAERLYRCRECKESLIDHEKIECETRHAWFHKACVRIDRRKKS
jgi:hypothetical protein